MLTPPLLEQYIAGRGERLKVNVLNGDLLVDGYKGEITERELTGNYIAELWSDVRQVFSGASRQAVDDFMRVILAYEKSKYNPFLEWVLSAAWDGTDRITDVLDNVLHIPAEDELLKDSPYKGRENISRILVRKWLWQGIALLHNGSRQHGTFGADGMLVLAGEQGAGKSSFFRRLAGEVDDWYIDDGMLKERDKDFERRCVSTVICEFGELQRALRGETAETMRVFITRTQDRYRLPYARDDTRNPRRTNLAGTVNIKADENFLVDKEGNRRFWTVIIPPDTVIDWQKITREYAQQLWRQAYDELFAQGIQAFRLTEEERELLEVRNSGHVQQSPVTEVLADILDGYRNLNRRMEWYKLSQWLAVEKQKTGSEELGRNDIGQIAKAMSVLGIKHKRVHGANLYELPYNGKNVGGVGTE